MVNDKINVVGTNIAEKAIMIWNVADMLRDPFKPHEYGPVSYTHLMVWSTWASVSMEMQACQVQCGVWSYPSCSIRGVK